MNPINTVGNFSNRNYFDDIGQDMVENIVSFLDSKTVCNIARTSKAFHAASTNEIYWKSLLEQSKEYSEMPMCRQLCSIPMLTEKEYYNFVDITKYKNNKIYKLNRIIRNELFVSAYLCISKEIINIFSKLTADDFVHVPLMYLAVPLIFFIPDYTLNQLQINKTIVLKDGERKIDRTYNQIQVLEKKFNSSKEGCLVFSGIGTYFIAAGMPVSGTLFLGIAASEAMEAYYPNLLLKTVIKISAVYQRIKSCFRSCLFRRVSI